MLLTLMFLYIKKKIPLLILVPSQITKSLGEKERSFSLLVNKDKSHLTNLMVQLLDLVALKTG